jgi:hypothetical protein
MGATADGGDAHICGGSGRELPSSVFAGQPAFGKVQWPVEQNPAYGRLATTPLLTCPQAPGGSGNESQRDPDPSPHAGIAWPAGPQVRGYGMCRRARERTIRSWMIRNSMLPTDTAAALMRKTPP